jgi:glutamyl-tRNA reductase
VAHGDDPVVFVLGANHRSAPMELRELLFIPEDQLAALLPQIRKQFDLLELAALSTCNRFELMGVTREKVASTALFTDVFIALQRHGTALKRYGEDDVKKSTYAFTSDEAVAHIHRVAASLDSLVLGETQITGQFKDAVALALRAETLGPMLNRLAQEALEAAKKVRTQTAIGRKHVSISHAAIDLAKKVFGDLSAHKFLIIGAGEMAQVAAKHVMSYKPQQIFIANRTVERARALVTELGFGEAFGLEELPSLLTAADIVISSTAAPGIILDEALVRRVAGGRRGRPLFLVDIALPRDIDPDCGDMDDVYLFNVDDLQQVVGQNFEERRLAAEEAQKFIDSSVASFNAWLKTLAVKPALASFRTYLDEVIGKEAAKTLGRDMFKDLTDKQRQSLDALFAAIAGKMSADASRIVKAPPEGYYPEQLADALTALFVPSEATKVNESPMAPVSSISSAIKGNKGS